MTASVEFERVSRHFGPVRAVDQVSFSVRDGEFFSMLGPSGSGKTTCLRMVAGFEQPSEGRILLHGQDTARLPPFERDVNTVFQDYALFPHMTVGDNIGYGPMLKRVSAAERKRQVSEMLELVRLPDMAQRRPAQLSGGQRQRVALARALINRPRVLLLDEPLGALDLKLRQQMQIELKAIQKQVGITFIYVTHDQEEALTMSDRLAVFNNGRIVQIGTPVEVYEAPRTAFVAGFVGVSNIVSGTLAERFMGVPGAFAIRPEKIQMRDVAAPHEAGWLCVAGQIAEVIYLGMHTRYLVQAEDMQFTVAQQNSDDRSRTAQAVGGQAVQLCWRREHIHVLEA